jgi:hypothetical protein
VIQFIFVNLVTFETPSCQIERSRNPMQKLCANQSPSQGENTKVNRKMNLLELIYVNWRIRFIFMSYGDHFCEKRKNSGNE